MLKSIFIALLFFLVNSTPIFAMTEQLTTLEQGSAISFRSHSANHAAPQARNMHMLIVNGLAAGCTSVYLYSTDNPFLYATALKAVSSRDKMLLIYDVDQNTRGPWGDSQSCMLTSITIIK